MSKGNNTKRNAAGKNAAGRGVTGKNNAGKNASNKKTGGAGNALIAVIAVVLCVAVAVTLVIRKNAGGGQSGDTAGSSVEAGNNTAGGDEAAENEGASGAAVISEGESLVIPVSDVSSVASFYRVDVDGTEMEILAVKDSEGNIRTAFNTCQICYGSGRGYYVQSGDVLVCQNCGNQFTVDHVEVESGGCNPWPIFPENKTVTDDTIEISYDFLKESKEIFANWKTQYS